MGGRGALIGFKNRAGHHNKGMTDTFDQDSITKKDTKIFKTLEKKNFVVMKSTDRIPEEIFIPNMQKVNSILQENPKLYEALGNKKIYIRSEKFSDPHTLACFDDNNPEKTQLIYNKSIIKQNRQQVEAVASSQIKQKFWTPSDKNELVNHVAVHELGHFVQRILIDKQAKVDGKPKNFQSPRYDLNRAKEMRTEIKKICYNTFGQQPKISEYGRNDPYEFFAEAFCEFYTTNNPSATAQALGIYLKEKL